MPLGVLAPACSSTKTSATGQLIRCSDHGAGAVDCRKIASMDSGSAGGSGADTCEDVDDDGDGEPHDQGEEHHGRRADDGSDHHGATAGSAGDDDDGDGVPNARDCDKRHGGDDADDDDDGSDHHDGSDDGSDHHDGSDHT